MDLLSETIERRVQERTAELLMANLQLQREIEARKRAEEEVKRLNRNLARQARELATLNKTGQVIASSLDLQEVLATVLEEARHLLDVVAGSIWLLEPQSQQSPLWPTVFGTHAPLDVATCWLVCRQATGPYSEVVRDWRLPPGQGIAGWVARSGKSLIVPDVRDDPRHFEAVDAQTGLALRSILTMPLRLQHEVIGVLQVVDTEVNRFTKADLALLEPVSDYAAIAIDHARLYEQTKRLQDFNANIVQGMEEGIVLEDTEGYITFVNANMARLTGYAPESLLGQHWTAIVPQEHVGMLSERVERRTLNVADRYEAAILTREGQQVPVIVSARSLATQGAGQSAPQFTGVLAVFTDITERKHVESAIQRRNEDLKILNTIATTVGHAQDLERAFHLILDKTLDITGIRAGALHLIRETDRALELTAVRGLPIPVDEALSLIPSGQGVIGQAAKWGKPIVVELPARLASTLQVQGKLGGVAGLPIKIQNRVVGVFSVFSQHVQDLKTHEVQLLTGIAHQIGVLIENTRQAEAAAQIEILQELNRLRSELIANASHELRTPLGLIKVFCTSLLATDVDFDEGTRLKFLQGIDEEADKLREIVDNLLELSTLESGRLRLDKRPTDLGALATKVVEALKLDLPADTLDAPGTNVNVPRHHFVLDFPTEPLMAPVDAKRIEQVLRNLLSNAVKYSPDGGKITVQGRGDKWQVLLRVSDEGIGISEENLERIFERFYRVDNVLTKNIGGVGLGLAVCQGIVEAHGGRIWGESIVDAGSHFYVTLPAGEHPIR